MNKRRTIVISAIIIAIVAVAGVYLFRSVINTQLVRWSVIQRQESNEEIRAEYLDPDVITVVLPGTAGPMSPTEAQTATAVFVNGQFLLFDAGDYAQKRMEQLSLPMDALDAVFITHFHNDHIADVGEVMQRSFMIGREKDLVIYGPTGTDAIVQGFNAIYADDSDYRTLHHTEEWMPSEFHFATASEFSADETVVEVYRNDGVVVTAFRVSHPPVEPVFGYTIEFAGKKVVISSDTLITEELRNQSRDADLLVMDVMNFELVELMENTFREVGDERNAVIFYDIREYHPDVNDIGVMAEEQGVQRMALTHFAPTLPSQRLMRYYYVDPIRANYSGELYADGDGTTVQIPLGGN
ncbi:MAG: MBL fold metallo-hydrolase [Chloroflexi bacterium]|nr:MBL fold metallo-hydrolase [Chloroflexota bacterium]MBK8935368.1 MBL fold metallo-hydrolase [Chloroflexota bacterium]